MTNLFGDIIKETEETGVMTVNRFIKLAANNLENGYYPNTEAIGENGDFITAPEASQLFGDIIGVWCANLWQLMGSPKNISLVELGPGTGTLISDILRVTKNIPGFHQAISLHLVEISDKLIAKQKEKLALYNKINCTLHKNLSQLPKIPSIFIGNEFFDALPINQYVKRKTQWYEIVIDFSTGNEGLYFTEIPIDEKMQNILKEEYPYTHDGAIVEICEMGEELIRDIATKIYKYGGGGLFLDYGYSDSKKRLYISSLQAIKNHQYWPIFKDIGTADISTQVNFTRLLRAAKIRGVNVFGPITQRKFLLNMHIKARKDALVAKASIEERKILENGYNRLIAPDKMGLLFKAISLAESKITGFLGY